MQQPQPGVKDHSTSHSTEGSADLNFTAHGAYRNISQNEFLLDCIIDGKGGLSIVHFYDGSSENCIAIDHILQDLSKKFPSCNFFRISGSESQLASKQFLVNRFPTVLAMRKRKVQNRIDHFGESEYFSTEDEARMLRRWVSKMITESQEG
jgi:hypothetical protein